MRQFPSVEGRRVAAGWLKATPVIPLSGGAPRSGGVVIIQPYRYISFKKSLKFTHFNGFFLQFHINIQHYLQNR